MVRSVQSSSPNSAAKKRNSSSALVTRATIAFLLVILFLVQAYFIYLLFTARIPSGNDFYPRWRGTGALLLEGKDPYSEEVTLEIQRGMYGRPARGDEDQVAFAYPLYASLFILPLALLPYPQAQALWLSGLVFLTLATVIIILRTFDWKPSPGGLLALSLWCLLLYPTARSIVLGQFTIPVLALVASALWAMQRGRDLLAGCSLALATIKPQMVILLLPTWIPSFLAGLSRYQAYTSLYTGGRSPLGILLDFLFPSRLSSWATLLISLALGGYLIYRWAKALRGQKDTYQALFLTIIVTLLIPVQTGTTNQVLLLLPLIFWLARWAKRWWVAIPLSLALLLGPWALFLATVRGDAEQPVMFFPLPLAALFIFYLFRRATTTEVRSELGSS